VLSIDGEDLRSFSLVQRKRRLARIMPRIESRLLLLDAIPARGESLFELACERDLEGIVAKWSKGSYQCDGRGTSWLKIKNPDYSQAFRMILPALRAAGLENDRGAIAAWTCWAVPLLITELILQGRKIFTVAR
jgi:hypothetical protein